MDPDLERLVGLLDELAGLLATHSQAHWAEWLARDAVMLRAGDARGLTHFLSAFGGIGSLNDLILSSPADNDRLRSLCHGAWTLASSLRREVERASW